jgi:hypothetical protein
MLNFFRYGEPRFTAKVDYIVESLTTEPMLTLVPDPWPAAIPTRMQIQTAATEYKAAKLKAENGLKADIDVRIAKRTVLEDYLRRVIPHLESVAVAANDLSILDSSGFDRRQPAVQPSPMNGTLPAPDFKVVRGTLSGTLIGSAKGVKGVFEGQMTTADPLVDANFKTAVISKRATHILFPNATPGVMHHTRLRGIGSNGPGAWSEVYSIIAV